MRELLILAVNRHDKIDLFPTSTKALNVFIAGIAARES
jgi:hypothetical protein